MPVKCNYNHCENLATTKGFVLTREHGIVEVFSCEKHRELNSFFESKEDVKK